ncbi:MAG: tRNA (adenosine(37)-N6)-dimethylallyltransferase MiaA [Microthrixaceae bacterium]
MNPELAPGRHLAIVGPTASGKSALALALAERRRDAGELVELVTVDSMQVYRGMNIGTASPTPEERRRVPHHLVDLADPDEEFSVAEFRAAADAALADIESRGGRAILVGGTGLYLQAVIDRLELPGRFPTVAAELEEQTDTHALHRRLSELDPRAAARIEVGNRRRILRALEVTIGSGRRFSEFGPGLGAYPPTPFLLCGLRVERELLGERIAARYATQMDAGFLEEVRSLAARPGGVSRTAAQALGYRELLAHVRGEVSLEEALGQAIDRTRQFAVRQIRWFRRDPRIEWFDHDGDPLAVLDALDAHWRRGAEPPVGGAPTSRDATDPER